MNLLKIPNHQNLMTLSISLTGVTHYKQGYSKKRHQGSKQLIEHPDTIFTTRKKYYESFPNEKPQKGARRLPPARLPATKQSQTLPIQVIPNNTEQDQESSKKTIQPKAYKINKRQITHRIHNYLNQMKGEKQLYFWTITFPKGIAETTAYRLFNTWLTRMRTDAFLKSYIWIAERQQNGTIHYHIAIHQRIPVQKANKFMRASLMRAAAFGGLTLPKSDLSKYNGVDLAKDRKTRRVTNFALKKKSKALAKYLTKYTTKSNDTFQNLAWHCSRDYSNLIISIACTPSEFYKGELRNFLAITRKFENDWIIFFPWNGEPPDKLKQYLAYSNQLAQAILS